MSAHAAPAPRRSLEKTRRVLAILVLPASILPLILLGPAMLRAPEDLVRRASMPLHATAAARTQARPRLRPRARTNQFAYPLIAHHHRPRPAARGHRRTGARR